MTITHRRGRAVKEPRWRLSNWIAIAVCLLALASLLWPRIFPSADPGESEPELSRAESWDSDAAQSDLSGSASTADADGSSGQASPADLADRRAADGSAAVLSNRQWIDQVDRRVANQGERSSSASSPGLPIGSPPAAPPADAAPPDRPAGGTSGSLRGAGASWSEAVANLRPEEYLQSLGGGRYRSPAGLLYGPGSEHGHRLLHIERHLVDEPSRPGPHGVFHGSLREVVQLIDRIYEAAERGDASVRVNSQGRRDTYEADFGEVIGFVGGQRGVQRGQPKARRVRVVLDGRNVITAFPY